MLEDLHRPRRRSMVPYARICIYVGIALILVGYGLMYSLSPERDFAGTRDMVFIAMGCIIAGAALWLAGMVFKRH